MIEGFDIQTAHRLSGLTTAMIGYLCRQGFVEPTISKRAVRGLRRRFSYADILIMRTIKTLLSKGVEVARVRNDLKRLRTKYADLKPTELPFRYLLTDGHKVVELCSGESVLDLKTHQYEFLFVIDIEPMQRDVNEILARLRPKAA